MTDQDKAPFNMAINTLERIGGILSDIHKIASDPTMSPEQKQFIRIEQIQSLFSQATPLLLSGLKNEETTKETKKVFEGLSKRVLKLKADEKEVCQRKGDVVIRTTKQLFFDPNLKKELLQIEIDIQLALQKLNYFMPPRRNLGSAVGDF